MSSVVVPTSNGPIRLPCTDSGHPLSYCRQGQRRQYVDACPYVSGAADAAYYVGECNPCRATIFQLVATLSAVGYSGTNATGVVIRD